MFDYRFNGLPNMLTAQMPFMPQNMLMTGQQQPQQIDQTATAAIPQQMPPVPGQIPQGDLNYFPPQPDANAAPITPQDYQASLSLLQPQSTPQQPQQQAPASSGGLDMGTVAAFLQGLGRGNGVLSAIGGGMGAVQERKQENQTIKYLTSRGIPEGEAQLLAQNPQATFQVLQNMRKGGDPKAMLELQKLGYDVEAARLKAQGGLDAKDRYMAVGKKVFDRQTGQIVDLPGGDDGSDTEYGLNPIWGQDETGNPVLGVLGKDGSFKKVDTGGFDISTGTEQIDLGDSFAIKDKRSGQIVGTVPKNLANAERDKKAGAAEGEALASYHSMSSKLPGLELVVEELEDLSDKATYTTTGKLLDAGRKELGMKPRDSALARAEYIAKVDNQVLPMLRDTFGAAFTQKEGETLRATLGDPDKSPAEKKAVLQAFIKQKRRDIQGLAVQGKVDTSTVPSGSSVVDYSEYFKQ
ncbi:hypothetical protein [Ochrobactrum sp. EDr1-4]|uniref:hypothetical protein n=1 Tax=Ochrobactrum sp. EDr1-4 TaxID=3368622 RepID=UPI003BA10ECD